MGGIGTKIVQNFVTSFMDDPMRPPPEKIFRSSAAVYAPKNKSLTPPMVGILSTKIPFDLISFELILFGLVSHFGPIIFFFKIMSETENLIKHNFLFVLPFRLGLNPIKLSKYFL